MKQTLALLLALGLAAPAVAQDTEKPRNPELEEGAEKLGEAFELLFKGLSKELEPLAEAWRDLLEDLPDYEAPEELPNGDIIIRRRDGETEV